MNYPGILHWVSGFFCLFAATELAYHIGKRPHGVTGEVCRGLSLQINSEFTRYGYGEMVDFVYQCVLKLAPGRCWADANDSPEHSRI